MNNVAVIGAGVMGAGIAAQIANAGVSVVLLDRPGVAAAALARMRGEPGPLMIPEAADLISPGDSESELDRIGGCDWIIEVIVERLDAKQALYHRIEAMRQSGSVVSSNTSTFRLTRLLDGLPERFCRDFLITHFFNPPRTMRLLEWVAGVETDPAQASRLRRFCDIGLGKTVVDCHDTPGFIANRIGAYWLQLGVNAARDLGLTVEEADAAMGRVAGIPKTGVFGLWDLIGLDVMAQIIASLSADLPPDDALQATIRDWPLLTRLIADGFVGRKGRGGFTRIDRQEGGRVKQTLDLTTGSYRDEQAVDLGVRDLAGLLALPGAVGAYARQVLGGTLHYAASLVPEAADDATAIDTAMRLGYGWKRGPFEMIDAIGADAVIAMVPDRTPPPLLALRRPFHPRQGDRKAGRTPVLSNGSAALWDLGDGVACFELTSKMGSVDRAILDLLAETIGRLPEQFAALVLGHDGEHFSAGANLATILAAARAGRYAEVESLIATGQAVFKALKYATFPVVAAPFGLALGGGCEIVLHAGAIQAHAELSIGLVECNVGLIPGWGGCGEMLERLRGVPDPTAAAFALIRSARISGSAAEARAMAVLRPGDAITMNRDRVLQDAKIRALSLVAGHTPPLPPVFTLPGPAGGEALMATVPASATAHDRVVAGALAGVLSGGAGGRVTEAELLVLERSAFMELIRHDATQARIEHTLATGKPLRN